MKKIFLLLITAALVSPAIAQETKQETKEQKRTKKDERKLRISAIAKQEEEGVIKYKKHTVFGVKLTTDGAGLFMEVARAQSVKKALLFQLDIAERKHIREAKQQFYDQNTGAQTNPIIYGKINFFYPVRLGVQQQFLLGNKGNKNGVAVSANVGGGLIAGLLRPYMIDIYNDSVTSEHKFVGYDPNDSTGRFLNPFNYYGGPSLSTGWNKLKFTPGLYVKAAVRFDFGKYNEMVNAVEVGISEEFFTKKIPQMINNKQKQGFFSAYVSVMFGKRK